MADAKTSWLRIVLPLVLLSVLKFCANAASFQHYQNLQTDPDYLMKNLQRLPNPDMVKALEFIENLRRQTGNIETGPDYNFYPSSPFVLQSKENKDQHSLADNIRESSPEDDAQWVKAMLDALKQGETESKAVTKENKPNLLTSDNIFLDGMMDDYDDHTWPDTRHRHSKMPHIYFEENSRDNPYKRTNEIVEEQYTPQSLATLESVFQELGKMMGPYKLNKERFNEERNLYADEEDDDAYKGNNIAYEDVVGGEDWNPIEEKIESETQEEIRDSKEQIEKNEEEINDEAKRADALEDGMEKENKNQVLDVSKLMDYYLKKMMKRPRGDNLGINQNEDKRAVRYFEKQLDPQAIYQLIEISRNLQIPPEDLLEMLKTGDKDQSEKEQEPEFTEDIVERPEMNLDDSDILKNKNPLHGYQKQRFNIMPDNLPEDLNFEDIINILGAENIGNQRNSYPVHQINQENGLPRWYLPSRSNGNVRPKETWLNHLERRQMEQDSLNKKEEELADYIAKMLTKYPEVINTGQMKQIPSAVSSEDDLKGDDQFEQTIKDHLNQVGNNEADRLTLLSKRLSMAKENESPNIPYMDEDMLAKVLEYLNQEKSEKGRNYTTKRAMENM